ncbi:FkbM family methyltransferase [Rhizobium hidalgonense]|uniref:Lipopolysaccharide biosynthesis protein n=1 Tax=Rhizobium hidalgonense TaxID=1538159 RepID=A0ABX4JID1_9HYPH|nr:FkbM family methyltransferase [Rhizobium hidalgonense]PDT19817.1 lipopolysaccharide biosynthesis protein [Rhizobium hidalgonense]PON05697.1 lipopolysaccharide biosynthesis protein [Rhizobium hidalgonense]
MNTTIISIANLLYRHCYPLYYPTYRLWKSYSDRTERALLRELVRPGMTIVDVGANIGVYTRFLSGLVGDSGIVHAFEPAPANYRRLRDNLRNLANVRLSNAAVGDRSGAIKLFISDELNVDHRTFDSGDGRQAISVPLASLDQYFPRETRVDLIKIDVQGYELSVLRGAERVLQENVNIKILMEYWPYGLSKAGVDPAALLAFIDRLDLDIQMIRDAALHHFDGTQFDPQDAREYCNLILSRRPRP